MIQNPRYDGLQLWQSPSGWDFLGWGSASRIPIHRQLSPAKEEHKWKIDKFNSCSRF